MNSELTPGPNPNPIPIPNLFPFLGLSSGLGPNSWS